MNDLNRSERIVQWIFFERYENGARCVPFVRKDIDRAVSELDVGLPSNPADIIYSFRHRTQLPSSIQETAPGGQEWVIKAAGKGKYCFECTPMARIEPNPQLATTKIPDATPGIIRKYALSDEQALLAIVRYNRLLDVFTGVACYSLQNHLRTTVPGMGQGETDELYVGVDQRGAQFVLPVEAKGHKENLSVVQIEHDIGVCDHKFPDLICRPIAAQFMKDDVVALFELRETEEGIRVVLEKHYRLVPPNEVSEEDLNVYKNQPLEHP